MQLVKLTIPVGPVPPCPAGFYASGATCVACGANTYSTTAAAADSFACANCPSNTASVAGSQFCTPNAGYVFSTAFVATACSLRQ